MTLAHAGNVFYTYMKNEHNPSSSVREEVRLLVAHMVSLELHYRQNFKPVFG